MKRQFSLLAVGLWESALQMPKPQPTRTQQQVQQQTPTYTSPVTTDSTNSMNNHVETSMNNGSMNNTNTTTPNSTYSTNTATPTDGTTTTTTTNYSTTDRPERIKNTKDYKNFVFGIYAGLNSTKLKGESTGGDISGRIGYQAGFFVRGGGRLFGQLGAEYFASSSNYFTEETVQRHLRFRIRSTFSMFRFQSTLVINCLNQIVVFRQSVCKLVLNMPTGSTRTVADLI